MPKVGDRVVIEGAKVGQQRREGSLIGVTGRLLNVRWSDGTTSMLTPGAGSISFEPGKGKKAGTNAKKTAKKGTVRKASAKKATTGKATGKSPRTGKKAAGKAGGTRSKKNKK